MDRRQQHPERVGCFTERAPGKLTERATGKLTERTTGKGNLAKMRPLETPQCAPVACSELTCSSE